jgi:thiol-disulfide isomerase/thioredoxin
MMLTSRRFRYLHEALVFSLLTVLAVAGAPAVQGSEAAAQAPVSQSAPAGIVVETPADLESAIIQVRSLYFGHDFHHGTAVGEAALERWPESSELTAWTIANLVSSSTDWSTRARAKEAVARAELMVESRPDDVWGAIALALALTHVWDPDGKALEASLRPLELAPTLPEAVWVRGFALVDGLQYQDAFTFIEEKWPVVDRPWVELLALKGNAYLGLREDPERVAEGLEILARVREHDPENVNAHFRAGNNLLQDRRRIDEGAALLERAATLSPGSLSIARSHWRAISDQPGLDAEGKKALIRASASEFLERRGQYPAILQQVGGFLESYGNRFDFEDVKAEGVALQDRVLTEFADTEEAELVLRNRWHRLSASLVHGQVEDTVAARAELSSMLWSFIDRPHHHSQLGDAYQTLFNHAWRDETVSPDTLLFLARGTAEHTDWAPQYLLANGLAERGVHLDAAREFARDGFDAVEEMVSERMEIFDTPGAAADYLDGALANVHAALGYVELKAGDLAAAREAIDRALELKPARTGIQFRAGALAEAEGDLERAAIHYAWGEREERMWTRPDKPNSDALERIYTERHGSMEGYEEFVAATLERDRDRRRQRVADTRIEEPRDLPAIDLEWLDGGRIGADELEDRIVVINFWGVWCGPCVAEAPQIQQLHEKYRDDPGVVFLTVNAFDPDLDDVRTWMVDNEYDWPVLVDDNFVTRYGVNSYPTTWFADREGRIVFEHSGASAAVYEEFVWRIEMLQAEAGAEVARSPVDPPDDLQSAIAQVRSLYFNYDFHHGAAEGEAALERWPESSELAAWTIANLSSSSAYWSGRAEEAVARAESLVESRPNDVWGAIALALALTSYSDRRGEALEASLRPLELAPTLAEAVWVRGLVLHDRRQYQDVVTLIEEKWPVVDRKWPELLNIKGNAYLAMPERRAEGLDILAGVREHHPENVNAHYRAGVALLWDRLRIGESVALLERAAALSPGSFDIARDHWRAISNHPDLDAEEKKALIRASASALVERRGHYPSSLTLVALTLGGILGHQTGLEDLKLEGAELGDRVLAEFAHTENAEGVLMARWQILYGRLVNDEVEDTVAARAELSTMFRSFIDRPHHHRIELLGDAYMGLFLLTMQDETVSPDTLLLLARGAAEHGSWLPHAQLASGLAERGVHLQVAREIARDGIDAAEEKVSERMDNFDTPGAAADYLDWALANAYAAIGYVELRAGDLAAAREAMDRALGLKPDNPQVQFQAGALAEAEGDLETAETHYALGEREERMWPGGDKPNSAALERIYTERHGSLEGYEEFLAAVLERDRDRRRHRVADSRIEEPRDLPAIDLEWLGGGRIGADELEGRIVVINFWGVWCGPCVAEAPQIQQFHEKYRDDPGVVFLTVNAFDPDLDEVRTWMADNEYDWPVLVDDNFATPSGVRGYPTTWFADRDGRIVFEHVGASGAVFEEFVWRVEMIQAEVGARVAGGAEAGG